MADENQQANDDIRNQAAAAKDKKDDKPAEQQTDKAESPKADDDIEQIASQADKPDAVKRALQAEREKAKQAREEAEQYAKKVKEYEDRDKSEQEKLEERASAAESKAATAEATLLRYQVATAKKLPLDLADRLQGKNKKELEEDADRLLELVKAKDKPSGDVDAGKGEGGGAETLNDQIRAAARR